MTTAPVVSGSAYAGSGRTVIRHREYIAEVVGSISFAATQYAINPGITTTFPWLAAYPALGYEMYHFKNLRFCYETQKSTASSGSVMLAIDYDASDPAPLNKLTVMSYNGAVRSSCWASISLPANQAMISKVKTRFIRPGALLANQDIKLYDVGNLWICTQGCADTSAMGELYVEYEVELFSPQLSTPFIAGDFSVHVTSGSTNKTQPLLAPTITGALPIVINAGLGNTIQVQYPGQYVVILGATGTVSVNDRPLANIVTAYLGATVVGIGTGNTYNNGAATANVIYFTLLIVTAGDGFTINYNGGWTTLTATDVRILPYTIANG